VSLLVLTALSLVFTLTAPLAVISVFASATFLLIFAAVNFSAFRLARKIKLHPLLPLAGGILASASFAMLVWHTWQSDRESLAWLAVFYSAAVAVELWLIWRRGARRMA
jgi:amino acid transporter